MIDIAAIQFNPSSRDDIPKTLKGLQHMFVNKELRQANLRILEKIIPATVDKNNGRPGMNLWWILVLGVLRTVLNCDYDRLVELANEHGKIRQMLLHGPYDPYQYHPQTIQDNLSLLTPEVLQEINPIPVCEGQKLVKKKVDEKLQGRCDSFVVKTNVRFPTDIDQLWEGCRY